MHTNNKIGHMKILSVVFLLAVLAIGLPAQTVFLAGATAGSSFGNLFLGATAGLEMPITKHYELDLYDTFSPLESHIKLGTGWANVADGGAHIWFTPNFGLNGRVSYSNYSVTKVRKGGDYTFGGVTWRKLVWHTPARFSLDYIREFNNGITSDGIESSHLQSGEFEFEARLGCARIACIREVFSFEVGHVLQQGNPVCDGEFGAVSCPRAGGWAGAFTGSLFFEFPRRRGHEDDIF
jgi:hypothetical protein